MSIKVKLFTDKSQSEIRDQMDEFIDSEGLTSAISVQSSVMIDQDNQAVYAKGLFYNGGMVPSVSVYASGHISVDDVTKSVAGDKFTHYLLTIEGAAVENLSTSKFKVNVADVNATVQSIVDVLNANTVWANYFTAVKNGTQADITSDKYGQEFNVTISRDLDDNASASVSGLTGGTGGVVRVRIFDDDDISALETTVNAWAALNNITYLSGSFIKIALDQDQGYRVYVSINYNGVSQFSSDHTTLSNLSADDHSQYLHLTGNAARNPLTGTIDASSGVLIIPTNVTPAQTVEGSVIWDSDDDKLTVGTGAGLKTLINDGDARLTDSRDPNAHTSSHTHGGSDEVGTATPGANAIPKAQASSKLANTWLEFDLDRQWLIGRNFADTVDLNILRLNADDNIEFGVNVVLSDFVYPADSGAVNLANMGITAAAAAGVEESISIALDAIKQVTVYSEADGAGGAKNNTFKQNFGQTFKRQDVADGNYTITGEDYYIGYSTLTANRIVYINDVVKALGTVTAPREFVIKDEAGTAGANSITITPDGGSLIDGAGTYVINTNYQSVVFITNGTNWFTK